MKQCSIEVPLYIQEALQIYAAREGVTQDVAAAAILKRFLMRELGEKQTPAWTPIREVYPEKDDT